MVMEKTQVLIIGAGASGLMAAISAARNGAAATLLDSGKKPAAKLLMTGNGRCNMTNLDSHLWDQYHSSCPDALSVLTSTLRKELSVPDTLEFFKELGLLTVAKGELIYPHSEQAKSVLDVLLAEARRLGVKIKLDGKVRRIRCDIENSKKRWYAATDTWEYSADKLILCAGSCAAPDTGSDGSGYELARSVGHTIVKPLPALTGLICAGDKNLAAAQGARSDGTVQLFCQYSHGRYADAETVTASSASKDGISAPTSYADTVTSSPSKDGISAPASYADTGTALSEPVLVKTESGQIQWAKDGISGVVIFQLSGLVSNILADGGRAWVHIDLVPDLDEDQLAAFLNDQISLIPEASKSSVSSKGSVSSKDSVSSKGSVSSKEYMSFTKMIPQFKHLLSGIVHDRLADLIIGKTQEILPKDHKHSMVQLDPGTTSISKAMASTLKHLPLQITGTRSFDQAQVCSGGISLDEVDPVMLESKLAPGLFFAGEILDADGPCGGYNLQWAWSTGYTAGKNAAR